MIVTVISGAAIVIYPTVDLRLIAPVEAVGLAMLFAWPPIMAFGIDRRLDQRLADLSLSLYVVHMPVIIFAAFVLWSLGVFPARGFPFGIAGVACWFGFVSLAFVVAAIFSSAFERRTDVLRRFLFKASAPRPDPTFAASADQNFG